MIQPDDTGPEGGRAVASRLVYDPRLATVDEATFNKLVALMRDGAPIKGVVRPPVGWRSTRSIRSEADHPHAPREARPRLDLESGTCRGKAGPGCA